MAGKRCPQCRLFRHESAQRCECGYDFVSDHLQESSLNQPKIGGNILSVEDAIRRGWRTAISNPKITLSYLVTSLIVTYIYSFLVVPDVLPKLSEEQSASNWIWCGFLFLLWITVQGYLFEGLSKTALKMARGQSTTDEEFVSFPTPFEFIKITIFLIFIIVVAFVLLMLIIPGIYFGLKYSQAYWIILEKRRKLRNSILYDKSAMKRSAELTKPKGIKRQIFYVYIFTGFVFFIINRTLGSIDYMPALIVSDVVKHFGYVFDVFVMAYVYVQLNPHPET